MRKTIFYIFLLLILVNCNSTVKPGDSALNEEVPYKHAKNYFVKNNVNAALDDPKIESQQDFDRIFGMAATMGENGRPTPIDFSKEFVVAQIEDPSNQQVELKPISVRKNSNILEVKYKKITGSLRSYTSQSIMLLIIDKKYDADVNLEEVK